MSTQPLDTPSELGLPIGAWRVDAGESRIAFEVKTWWGLATVRGRFSRFGGTFQVQPGYAAAALSIRSASLFTGHQRRDDHLRSIDFFGVEEFPEITFTATAITPRDPDGLTIAGDLEIGGRSLRLQLPVDVTRGDLGRLRFTTRTTVARDLAGMTWNRLGQIRGTAKLFADLELVVDPDGVDLTPDFAADVA